MARRVPEKAPAPFAQSCELFDFLPEVQFWIKDHGGRYEWVNAEFLLNYALKQREEVIGRTDFDLSPPHLAAQYDADDQFVRQRYRRI